MTSTGRINYIDELKGFILCLVCLGHIAYSELSYVMNWMSLMKHIKFSRNNIKFHMFLMCYFFQNLHIGKFFYMGNSIMVRFYSMDC